MEKVGKIKTFTKLEIKRTSGQSIYGEKYKGNILALN